MKTLGDHLRKRRLDLGLLQRDVARMIGAAAGSIIHWETNRMCPSIRFIPKIIDFLGYLPGDIVANRTFGERIVAVRKLLGISQAKLAEQLNVDPSTLRRWEMGKSHPPGAYMEKLDLFLASGPSFRR